MSWPALRSYVLERDHSACQYCCDEANTVDHIVPRAQGGLDQESNLVAACARCNSSKGALTPYEWALRDRMVLPPWWYKDATP